MAELSNSGCEYCQEDRDGYRARFGAFSIANPSHGSVWTISTGHCEPRQIFFCPICGRKLAEPAKELEKKEPLTLEELRKMAGEPVWVETSGLKEWCIVHSYHSPDVVGGGFIMTRRTAEKRTYAFDAQGETWTAYRRKPEERGAP